MLSRANVLTTEWSQSADVLFVVVEHRVVRSIRPIKHHEFSNLGIYGGRDSMLPLLYSDLFNRGLIAPRGWTGRARVPRR